MSAEESTQNESSSPSGTSLLSNLAAWIVIAISLFSMFEPIGAFLKALTDSSIVMAQDNILIKLAASASGIMAGLLLLQISNIADSLRTLTTQK